MSEWSSTNVTHPDESEIQRGKKKSLSSPFLPLTHTHTDQSKATAGKSVVWKREKKSINASVGLPWLEHGTVSLLSGCVNLFCLVCCESVSRLKHSSMPAWVFFFFLTFFPLLFRLPVTLQCTVVLMFPISVSGEASSQCRMEYRVTHRRTNSTGCFRWCGAEQWNRSPRWEPLCAASTIAGSTLVPSPSLFSQQFLCLWKLSLSPSGMTRIFLVHIMNSKWIWSCG